MANEQAGKPITAEQANHYLKKYVEIRENLQQEAIPLKNVTVLNSNQKSEAETFYASDINAFIFSKELIERFFSGVDENNMPQPKADYLMVIVGAKYEAPDVIGTPTVVVAGVNKTENNDYKALNIPYAADQQPPTGNLVEFPSAGGAGSQPIKLFINLQ